MIEKNVQCVVCDEIATLKIQNEKSWDTYVNVPKHERPPVQELFPELSADDRERLISGMCPTCCDAKFGWNEMSEEELLERGQLCEHESCVTGLTGTIKTWDNHRDVFVYICVDCYEEN